MPKSHRKRMRKGGGWFDDLKNSTSSMTSGFGTSSWTSGLSSGSWNPFAKKTTTPSYQEQPMATQPMETQSMTTQPMTTQGGRRRSRRSKRGGSYSPNMSQTNLAASASPYSGGQTVKAQTWVGGKTKKRRHRRKKSRKHY